MVFRACSELASYLNLGVDAALNAAPPHCHDALLNIDHEHDKRLDPLTEVLHGLCPNGPILSHVHARPRAHRLVRDLLVVPWLRKGWL